MVNDKVDFDFGADFADSNYKSSFARSIAVNSSISQKQAAKSLQPVSSVSSSVLNSVNISTMINGNGIYHNGDVNGGVKGSDQIDPVVVVMQNNPILGLGDTIVKLRKPLGITAEDTRRYSCNSGSAGSRRTSICSSRITEVPDVETVLLQSQVDTLQWQLKQTLESRKMYRNVMKQVVTFLDRAHKNLQLLGKKMNTSIQPSTVSRSKSEHHVNGYHSREASISSATLPADCADYESISDYSWRQSRKPDPPSPDEVPPEKLSQEAFRLLRTVQSLLNTREPDLSSTIEPPPNATSPSTSSPTPSDIDFLVQLAKEFPSQEPPPTHSYRTPNRTTSFSLSPKLLTPEKDSPNNLHRFATAFNRKLSLQLSDSNCYSPSNKHLNLMQQSSPRTSVADSDYGLLSSTVLDEFKDPKAKFKFEPEKSNSPPVSTVSSIEDESGFSSMNSFQEVGLPAAAPEDPKMALLKSMLHTDEDDRRKTVMEDKKVGETAEELWQRPQVHKRWSSTPVDAISTANDKQALKVLWV